MPGWPGPGIDELALDGREEALRYGVVPAFSLPRHRQDDAVLPGQGGEVAAGVLGEFNRSMWKITPSPGRRAANAVDRASVTRLVRMWSARAQPTTRRLDRSMTVARYAQPSHVATYVMSPA